MAATTLGFIPLQLIPTNAIGQYNFDKGFPANGTYVVVKTPTVAQQLQLTKSLKEMQNGGKEINNNENANKPVLLRCKRRVDFTGLGCKLVDSQSPSVSRRNERERKRVKMVNMGFETLRQHVPVGRKNKKMSKVETLRSAVQYIKQLQEMLETHDSSAENRLLDNVDMDELENKVTEMIQNANENNNNLSIKNGLELSASVSQEMSVSQNLGHHMEQTTQQNYYSEQTPLTPQSSPELPQSPNHTQEHFFQSFQNCQPIYTTQFDNVTSSSASGSVMSYSQASPAGSLHSPTSSVVSDSSYDSVGHEDDDILSFSNWF